MKLQGQYTRVTVISTLFILLIAAGGYYLLLRAILINELDDALKVEEVEIYDHIKKNNSLPDPTVFKDQRISFEQTGHSVGRSFRSFSFFDKSTDEKEFVRQLVFPVTIANLNYAVSVTKSEEATEDLLWIILLLTVGLIILLFITLLLINRFLLKKLWRPFTDTLSSIKEFNLLAPGEIQMQPTNITEFREMNETIRMMAQKVMKDYQSLKNFTDHASHEMQTPLAIISSRLDVIIQSPELSEQTMMHLDDIYKAVHKLSRLGQSLLLLARIENNQYSLRQPVRINGLVEEKRNELEELTRSMNLDIKIVSDQLVVNMNSELAEIMVSNLFINAIRHNSEGGKIEIQTGNGQLSICNSGKASLDKERIFSRFYKSEDSGGSGLGLAIVRQICDQYGFTLNYEYSGNQHCFQIKF